MTVASNTKIDALQALRAFAALLVVFHHSKDFSLKYGHENWVTDFLKSGIGAFGVDIFFVLSGFIMFYTTKPSTSGRVFLLNRLARVAPMYWFVTTFLAVLLIYLPNIFSSMRFEFWHYVKSIFFIPHNSPAGDYLPLLGVGWTLCFEMYFYLIFAVLIRFRKWAFPIVSGYLALMAIIGVILPAHDNRLIWTLTSSLNLEFAFGAGLAYLYSKIGKSTIKGVCFVVGGALLAYVMRDYGGAHSLRGIAWGMPATLIVLGFILMSDLQFGRVLILLGDSSYSLYLVHVLSLPFIWKLFHVGGIQQHGVFLMFFAVLFSVFISVMAWKYIETPISQKARLLLHRWVF